MNKKKIISITTFALMTANISMPNYCYADTTIESNEIENGISNDEVNTKSIERVATGIFLNGVEINKQLININYSKGVTTTPKYIVIHDTDNRRVGSNAQANRDYFANHPNAQASAHYTVDQSNIIQVLEDNWMGWHVGDGRNTPIKNSNTIGIELCVNADNDFNKTLENGIALTKYLMKKHNIPASNVVRHYDVSGKICPKMMIKDDPSLWVYFKSVISGGSNSGSDVVDGKPKKLGKIINVSTTLNVREKASGTSNIVSSLKNNSEVKIYGEENGWYKISYSDYGVLKYGYVSKSYVHVYNDDKTDNEQDTTNNKPNTPSKENKTGKVVNISSVLNVRNQSSSNGLVIAYLSNGEEVEINYEENGWYNVTFKGNKTGFVSKKYIEVIKDNDTSNQGGSNSGTSPDNNGSGNSSGVVSQKKGQVVNVSTSLNVRNGASSASTIIGTLKPSDIVNINSEVDGWYNITFNGDKKGYVSKSFIKIIDGNTSSKPNTDAEDNNESQDNNTKPAIRSGKVTGVSTNLNVRKGPGTSYLITAYLTNNTIVDILGEQNGWYNIRLKDGKEGYVSKQYIQDISSSPNVPNNNQGAVSSDLQGEVINVSTNLNVRSGAGTNYSVVAYLLPGKKVTVKGTSGEWYKIETEVNGSIKTGYVKSSYVKIYK